MSCHKVLRLLQVMGHGFVRAFKKCRMPLAILMILIAIVFSIFRALTPWVKQYKGDVENHLSLLLGQPVSVSDLETSWYWFQPVLKMHKVAVHDHQNHPLELNQLLIGIDLWSSLLHWQLQPGVFYVDDVHLTIRQIHHHWEIDGLGAQHDSMRLQSNATLPILTWLLAQQRIILKNVSADCYLDDGSHVSVVDVNLSSNSSYGHHRIKAHATLDQKVPTALTVIADLQLPSLSIQDLSGHLYVSLDHFSPTQWQKFFPKFAYHIQQGEGDLSTWIDLEHGHVASLQSIVEAQHVKWAQAGSNQTHTIDHVRANLAMKKNSQGWRMSADQIQLTLAGIAWPENSMVIEYHQAHDAYHAFVKTVLVQSLLSTDLPWPQGLNYILAMHPEGELHNTQLDFKKDELKSILTRFRHLGWRAQPHFPGVRELSGALYWQPNGGRFDIDSENTTLYRDALPPVTLSLLNASFEWKELSHGLRVNMDRFVMSHPSLLLSAQGVMDNPHVPHQRHLNLKAEFYSKNAQTLLPYLPQDWLQPALNDWLKTSIPRIDQASGRLKVQGFLDHFPFDDHEGELTLQAHASGVDVWINKNWPLNQNVEADLTLNRRDLQVDVKHVDLLGVMLENIRLAIPAIGLGQEALLLHANIVAPGDKIKQYIFNSPLKDHLSLLHAVDVDGDVGLDLHLDIPLYPERDHVVAQGLMKFDDNKAAIHGLLHELPVSHVAGDLAFNEYRITDGQLIGTIHGDPLTIHSVAIQTPIPHTQIQIQGKTTVQELRQMFGWSGLQLMSGHMDLQGLISLFDGDTQSDSLILTSSLEGMSLNLPSPLGKSSNDIKPLRLEARFNPDKTMEIQAQYDHQLSADILFKKTKKSHIIKQGQLRLGSEQASLGSKKGLEIIGVLSSINTNEWREAWHSIASTQKSSDFMHQLSTVDVKAETLIVDKESYPAFSLHAHQPTPENWTLQIEQKNVAANLQYHVKDYAISGQFSRLYLPALQSGQGTSTSFMSSLTPKDLPALNISIDDVKLGEVHAGKMNLRSRSTASEWILEECSFETPEYGFNMQGGWSAHQSHAQATLHVDDLSHSLERWKITPAVEAHSGVVDVQGEWPGVFTDFSLKTIQGQMKIVVKNGRISQLDKETERKLGLGKLLSILSLQTIPRRLKLDFSDLSQEGYSFDVFKGTYQINAGVMHTDDSYIDGPVAYATMKGTLDLVHRLYDLDLRVAPYITASIPIVVAAFNPVAGVATWVASKIINKGLQQISGYTYKISGPWADPIVQQVSIDRKAKKTPRTDAVNLH